MKFDAILKVAVGAFALTASFVINAGTSCNMPDSVLLFSYSKADGRSGLRLAWSEDGIVWNSIADPAGPADAAYDFVSSDFGPWGSHKTMFAPVCTKLQTVGSPHGMCQIKKLSHMRVLLILLIGNHRNIQRKRIPAGWVVVV